MSSWSSRCSTLVRGDLMREVEIMLRTDLQNLIREESLGAVNAHIDDILDKIDTIEDILN